MFSTLANWLLGCSHRRTSFPITCRTNGAGGKLRSAMETYVVCLDCGQRFVYDWESMRLTKQLVGEASKVGTAGEPRPTMPFPAANRVLQRLVHHT